MRPESITPHPHSPIAPNLASDDETCRSFSWAGVRTERYTRLATMDGVVRYLEERRG